MLKMKKVLNKILGAKYGYCRNCVFKGKCGATQNPTCGSDDYELITKYRVAHIYIVNETSSQ